MAKGMIAIVAAAALSVGLLGAAGVARADATNLIVNGGFETGDFTGFNTSNLNATSVTSSPAVGYNPQSGSFFAALGNIGTQGIISQTFSDVVGAPLVVSFYYASNGIPSNGTQGNLSASFNNVPIFTTVNPPNTSGYVRFSADLIGTGSDTLSFSERNDPSFYALDSISVTSSGSASSSSGAAPSPEVNTLLGFLVVGGTVAFMKRKRRGAGAEGMVAV